MLRDYKSVVWMFTSFSQIPNEIDAISIWEIWLKFSEILMLLKKNSIRTGVTHLCHLQQMKKCATSCYKNVILAFTAPKHKFFFFMCVPIFNFMKLNGNSCVSNSNFTKNLTLIGKNSHLAAKVHIFWQL